MAQKQKKMFEIVADGKQKEREKKYSSEFPWNKQTGKNMQKAVKFKTT